MTSFQSQVLPWLIAAFDRQIVCDKEERNRRFLEEALELVQSLGMSKEEAHWMVRYVYERPQGEINQEVGGVMVTLASLCIANSLDMHKAGDDELGRVWNKINEIRLKQAAKPKWSPEGATPPVSPTKSEREELEAELKELEEANDAADGWGAAVGARSSRIKRIRVQLACLDNQAKARDERKAQRTTDSERARAEGFEVDTFVYPWFAYKGPRFGPTQWRHIRTDAECGMQPDILENY